MTALLAFIVKNSGALLIVAALAVLMAAGFYVKGRFDGASNATTKIERQNNDAASDADSDRTRFDACPSGLWDFAARKCRGAASRGGN